MLKTKRARCEYCGVEMPITRRTRRYCKDAHRKAASREANSGRRAEDGRLIETLWFMGYVGRIWPIYAWDESPRVYALLVPRHLAVAEVNLALRELDRDPISEADLVRAMRLKKIADYGNRVEAELIGAFYRARKDRRTREGL
jgi:hypothetical protein